MNTPSLQLENKRIGFLGKLGAMSRKEACQWLKEHSASPAEKLTGDLDLVVIGADELPDDDIQAMLGAALKERIRTGATRLIHEHELWMELGLIDDASHKQLYTPAMVAGLVKTRVNAIRRWHRCGLLPSVKVTHKLPYFDFEQVQCAKQIAAWVTQGANISELKKQLDALGNRVVNRSLLELDLRFDGRRILLRDEGVLIGAHGQLFLDFDSNESGSVADSQGVDGRDDSESDPAILTLKVAHEGRSGQTQTAQEPTQGPLSREAMILAAEELEDRGQFDEAIEWYRVILAQFGQHPEIVFTLAELLLRVGEVHAARERYYNAIELDEDFVEARASLGCVLAETGQLDLAVAAFQGALMRDENYPDVHYHLASALDELNRPEEATKHWLRFLQLSPQSPWADEALERLGRS
jgi:tetratricopeptide (TPR) repeat protein